MDEKILPDDLDEVLNKSSIEYKFSVENKQVAPVVDYAKQSNWNPPSNRNVEYVKPQFAPAVKPFEPVGTKTEQKKKNIFIRVSNNIASKPKLYLVLIIALIIIILILFIYYNGLLFIGPFCPNNIKSQAYKNNMSNGDDSRHSKNISGSHIDHIKEHDLLSSLKI